MPFPHSDFDALSTQVASLLAPAGFEPGEMERNSAFGSHFSNFANGARLYRLVWDGKESWLLVQYCDNFQGVGCSSWNDVAIFRAGRERSSKELASLGVQVVEALRNHLSSYAA